MKSGLKFIRRDKEKFIMGEALLLSSPIITAFVLKFVKSLITRACRWRDDNVDREWEDGVNTIYVTYRNLRRSVRNLRDRAQLETWEKDTYLFNRVVAMPSEI